jgi:hypothetical protein
MKQGLTHIIFIVDRSGSMSGIAKDMIGGYNTFIKKQKETPGECFVSFYQFDDVYEPVFERVALSEVKDLDDKTYVPRNMTALYDAIGKTVNSYGEFLAAMKEEDRPERVLVVVITDGQNNASHEFTLEQVRNMIQHQTDVYKWDFVFLGSNIDSWAAGGSLGVKAGSTLQFANVSGSVSNAFNSLSKNTVMYRSCAMKAEYSFAADDYADQDSFLDGTLKSKNKAAQQTQTPPTKTASKK